MPIFLMNTNQLCIELRNSLARHGTDLRLVDNGDLKTADKVIFFNLDNKLLRHCLDAGLTPERLALLLYEPDVIQPDQYDSRVWKCFGQIFTWRDDLVDNSRFFKLRWPQMTRPVRTLPGFEDRKLLAMINTNKYGYIDGEGYSYRRKAIRFFDGCGRFDLYGHGWNNLAWPIIHATAAAVRSVKLPRPLPAKCMLPGNIAAAYIKDIAQGLSPFVSYAGTVSDKDETLAKYRFCLCIENQLNYPGYVTEKLFDCFFSGTVPVYLGAANVEEYVPRDCFISMSNTKDFSTLLDILQSMGPAEFGKYQQAGRNFVTADAFHEWTHEGVYESVADRLMSM
ncbi:glycosyltransferase family 10 [bacterium]|nr:glycosyltransferase family 10 [bacterium]